MNKEEKITREFFEKFGANTIWVVPSKENVETILDIHQFLLKTLKFQREEIVEKINELKPELTMMSKGNEEDKTREICRVSGYLLAKEEIINLITKEDETL